MSDQTRTLTKTLNRYQNPKSLIDTVPKQMVAHVKAIPEELLNVEESQLLDEIRKYRNDPQWVPSPSLESLRIHFWAEYDNAARNMRRMIPSNIYWGVIGEPAFLKLQKDPSRLSWLICMPLDYAKNIDALITMGLRRVADIFKMDINDPKTADVIVKTFMMLDMRKHGGYMQRSEQKIQSQVLTQNLDSIDQKQLIDVDSRIRELERKAKESKALPAPVTLIGLPKDSE